MHKISTSEVPSYPSQQPSVQSSLCSLRTPSLTLELYQAQIFELPTSSGRISRARAFLSIANNNFKPCISIKHQSNLQKSSQSSLIESGKRFGALLYFRLSLRAEPSAQSNPIGRPYALSAILSIETWKRSERGSNQVVNVNSRASHTSTQISNFANRCSYEKEP